MHSRLLLSGPCLRVHALKLRERETARWWDEVNDNMSDCHGSSHTLGCTGPYNCYSVSRTRHAYTRAHTDTYTRGRPFNFPSVSRFCAKGLVSGYFALFISLACPIFFMAPLPSFLACLLRLGLFFSSFFWNLRWTPRDRFAGLLLWWGFKLEIICRGTRGNVARVVSVELNVPRVSLSVVERSCRNFERNL